MITLKSGIRLLVAAAAAATLSAGAAQAKTLLGVGIASSDDHVYYWYADQGGQVSAGTTGQPTAYRNYAAFPAHAWGDLVAVDIAPDDRVFYWWEQPDTGIIIVTVGTSKDPDAYEVDYGFVEQANRKLIGAGIAKSSGLVYYYWQHKTTGTVTRTKGTRTVQYTGHDPLHAATTLISQELLEVSIAGDDHVYYWWRNKTTGLITVTAGTSIDPFAYRPNHYNAGM